MKRTFRLTAFFLAIILLTLTLSSCGESEPVKDFSNEYNPETDFNFNIESHTSGRSVYTASDKGLYLAHNGFVYFLENGTDTPLPLCKRADCLHDRAISSETKEKCEAYIAGDAMFFYNGELYIVGSNRTGDVETGFHLDYVLNRYSPEGTLLGTVYTFHAMPDCAIRHRGYLYYTYGNFSDASAAGNCHLVRVSLTDGTEETLYDTPLKQGTLANPLAYGKYLYFWEDGLKPENDEYLNYVLVCDLETGACQPAEMPENSVPGTPLILDNELANSFWFMDYRSPENKTLYTADLDGQNLKARFTLAYDSSQEYTDGTYLYEDNMPLVVIAPVAEHTEDNIPPRMITVYRDLEKVCEFELGTVDGVDLSKVSDKPRITDDRLLFPFEDPDTGGWGVVAIDKSDFESGAVTPYILFRK